jgi:hypothetical protein
MGNVVSESGDKAITWVQALQAIFGGGPAAAVGSIFCIAFFALLAWHLYSIRAAHAAHLEAAIRAQASTERLGAMEKSIHLIARDVVRHHSKKPPEAPKP